MAKMKLFRANDLDDMKTGSSSSSTLFLPGLPNEIGVCCLARIPFPDLHRLRAVCRGWREFLRTTTVWDERRETSSSEAVLLLWTRTPRANVIWYGLSSSTKKLFKLPSMPDEGRLPLVPFMGCASAIVDGKLFMIGGRQADPKLVYGHNLASSVVSYFNLKRWEWKHTASLNGGRTFCETGVIHGKLYVCGGITKYDESMETTEVYDPITQTWKLVANIPTLPMMVRNSTALDGWLHVLSHAVGEIDQSSGLVGVVYDPHKDIWTKMPDVFNFGWCGKLVNFNGTLYCEGRILDADGIQHLLIVLSNQREETWELSDGSRVPKFSSYMQRFPGYQNRELFVMLDGALCVISKYTQCKKNVLEIKDVSGNLIAANSFRLNEPISAWDAKVDPSYSSVAYELVRL